MNKDCAKCGLSFEISEGDLAFYDRMKVFPPQFCNFCRDQRRLAWRNERNIYRRTCDSCKKPILSIYSPDKGYKVYCTECWWSDKWNPLDHGMDYDFKRPFFDQFNELMKKVPHLALMNVKNENCDYINQGYANKNCYMTIATDLSEDCYYIDYSFSSNDCVDCLGIHDCQYCCECVDCVRSYQCFFSQDLRGCRDCWFSRSLRNCNNCFGCSNLANKEYYIFNEPASKQQWEELVSNLTVDLVAENRKKAFDLAEKLPHLYAVMTNCEDCTGNYLSNCKNARYCFDGKQMEDCKYCSLSPDDLKDSYDICGGKGELLYECFSTGAQGVNCKFCGWCWNIHDLDYCLLCMNDSHNLFGCMGLKHQSYCILNKQYSKEEYESFVARIIEQMKEDGEWGEFFPAAISPFGYNETAACENYPLEKQQAIEQGFKWTDYEVPVSGVEQRSAVEIPASSSEITDDLLKYNFKCEFSGRLFRFIKQELDFYRKFALPLPRIHPQLRSLNRLALRNPRKLWYRKCDKCGVNLQTSYDPEKGGLVYCEKCYLGEMY